MIIQFIKVRRVDILLLRRAEAMGEGGTFII